MLSLGGGTCCCHLAALCVRLSASRGDLQLSLLPGRVFPLPAFHKPDSSHPSGLFLNFTFPEGLSQLPPNKRVSPAPFLSSQYRSRSKMLFLFICLYCQSPGPVGSIRTGATSLVFAAASLDPSTRSGMQEGFSAC